MLSQLLLRCTSVIAAIIFPPHCYLCKKENEIICKKCLATCTKAIDSPASYITSIYSYKDIRIKKTIHAIKYFHRKDLLLPFAKILAYEISTLPELVSPIIIPIPMPQSRKYLRGYNHGEALAYMISQETKLETRNDILLRNPSKEVRRQVKTHSRGERLRNQQNAFFVKSSVQGMNIILIDDVTTTGATLHEARKILLGKGALRVVAFTIAH